MPANRAISSIVKNELNPTSEVQNLGNGHFKMPHVETPRLQTAVFQTVIVVASGLCMPFVNLSPLCPDKRVLHGLA